jgi:hypothetical protein
MNADDTLLIRAIRHWLSGHPLTDGSELDVHGVPEDVFDLAVEDDWLRQLNRQIRRLPAAQQRLLRYLSRDIDPALIIESMEYSSPELFWLDKALLVKEIDPSARQQDVLQVFDANESLVAEIIRVSDLMDEEGEKSHNRRFRKWSLIAAPVLLIILFTVIYPLLFKPDPVALYDRFINRYTPVSGNMDSLSLEGVTFYEGIDLLEEGSFSEAAGLFTQVIQSGGAHQPEARWFLALSQLRTNNRDACIAELKALRSESPVVWEKTGAASLLSKISR